MSTNEPKYTGWAELINSIDHAAATVANTMRRLEEHGFPPPQECSVSIDPEQDSGGMRWMFKPSVPLRAEFKAIWKNSATDVSVKVTWRSVEDNNPDWAVIFRNKHSITPTGGVFTEQRKIRGEFHTFLNGVLSGAVVAPGQEPMSEEMLRKMQEVASRRYLR